MFLDDVVDLFQTLLFVSDCGSSLVNLSLEGFSFRNQSGDVSVRGEVVSTESFEDFSVLLLVKSRGNTCINVVSPPFLDLCHFVSEVGVTLGNLELNRNGVLDVRDEFRRVVVVLLLKEGSYHDYVIHTEQISVESRL